MGWLLGVLVIAFLVVSALLLVRIAVTFRPPMEVIQRNKPTGPEWVEETLLDRESGHYLAATCWCQPTVEYIGDGIAVTHKATLDGGGEPGIDGAPITVEQRVELARSMGRMQAEQDAVQVLGRIVVAAGGEVRVPDNLAVQDVTLHSDFIEGVTVYRAALSEPAEAGEP